MKENLLLLKDFLELWRIKSTNMTLVSRNVSIDMLDNIVDKFNKKYQRTINMKPIDVKWSTYINFVVDIYLNIKTFSLKFTIHIGQNRFLWLKKLKTLHRGHLL